MDLQSTRSIAKLSIVRVTVQPATPAMFYRAIKYFTSPLARPRSRRTQIAATRIYLVKAQGLTTKRLDLTPPSTTIFLIIHSPRRSSPVTPQDTRAGLRTRPCLVCRFTDKDLVEKRDGGTRSAGRWASSPDLDLSR